MAWSLPVVPVFLLSLVPGALRAAGSGRVPLPGSVRAVAPVGTAATASVPAATVRPTLTSEEAATPLQVETVLKMRNFAELQSRVTRGETISRAEMAARYLPTASDYQAVAEYLTAQGLTVGTAGASRAVVKATGNTTQLQRAFGTGFARVSFQGEEYTAATDTPSLPTDIEAHVASVHGLQPYLHPHKSAAIRRGKAAASSDFAPPYMVSDILTAYNVAASGLTGAGQQIGIVIDTVPSNSDLTKFWSANGISQSLGNVSTVNVEGGRLPAASGEETLDVSWSSGVAPGAQIVVYACGDLNNVNDAYSRILDDLQDGSRPNLHQISMSYGAGEKTDETDSDIQSVNQMFTAITAYGVSLFAASGDYGSNADGDRVVQVLYPASDPTVTGVGGTSLYLNSATGAISNETAWAVTSAHGGGYPGGNDGSSGGGISDYFARPSWQVAGTVTSTMRLVPDVAFAGDPDTGCYLVFDGEVEEYGGTSWGSPCWAALCALVNQARTAAGISAVAGLNPSLYPLLGTAGFHDITGGSNGNYSAAVGYDLVTGLGTPNFDVLLPSLEGTVAAATESAPVVASATTASATVGTAFAYQITASQSPTSFNASGLPGGLSVDTTTGLIAGTPTAAGTFAVTLSATNSGGTGTATLTLSVAAAPTPVVTMTTPVSQVTLGSGTMGEVELNIPATQVADLSVAYTVKGSASNGVDYVYLSGQARIKAGKTRKILKIIPQGDLDGAAKKVVKITLEAGDGYTVGTTGFAKVSIVR